jgi:predicted transcriptional regulator
MHIGAFEGSGDVVLAKTHLIRSNNLSYIMWMDVLDCLTHATMLEILKWGSNENELVLNL